MDTCVNCKNLDLSESVFIDSKYAYRCSHCQSLDTKAFSFVTKDRKACRAYQSNDKCENCMYFAEFKNPDLNFYKADGVCVEEVENNGEISFEDFSYYCEKWKENKE